MRLRSGYWEQAAQVVTAEVVEYEARDPALSAVFSRVCQFVYGRGLS